ncbi:MAG: DNA adenine methylase [Melioribacteraceae bacterium]|nr:DNA adenine methylase [Melioribacteraceae bacterium]
MSGVKNRLIPFNYFGGKFGHADWVIKHLPQTKSYVEVFGGSAVILINKKPCPIETYNDLNSTVVNFFRMLREKPNELLNKIFLTPYSKEEYLFCYQHLNGGGQDDVERARRFFVAVGQSFNGTYSRQTGWKMSTKESRAIISEAVNRWITKLPNLVTIIERLRRVQIANYDFRLIFKKFDGPDTLFYCDPPYMHETRCNNNEYEFDMSDTDHKELLEICKAAKGRVAISGYDNPIYNKHLKGFYKLIANKKPTTIVHSLRQEILWTNYNPDHINENLFTKNI